MHRSDGVPPGKAQLIATMPLRHQRPITGMEGLQPKHDRSVELRRGDPPPAVNRTGHRRMHGRFELGEDRQSTDKRHGRGQYLLLGRKAAGELLGQADVRAGVIGGAYLLNLRSGLLVRTTMIAIGFVELMLNGNMPARTKAHHQAIRQPQRRESLRAEQEDQDEQPV